MPDIATIARNLATQDNRVTDAPIFIVQQKRRIDGMEEADDWYWVDGDWNTVEDVDKIAELEAFVDENGHDPEGYTRRYYITIWEFVTACFTEQGCEDYIAANGHNLKEPRIYAEGSFRNEEWRAVRQFLLGQRKDGSA